MTPDERAMRADLKSARFMIGSNEGRWGVCEPSLLPPDLIWPDIVLWVTANGNGLAPKYYFKWNCEKYPIDALTGNLWDPETKNWLSMDKRPQIAGRGEKVFVNPTSLYHPYDRVAANSHGQWKTELQRLVWDRNHSIVDLLEELHLLLN
ncbi:MAG TPA: hypothetical protein VMJ32_14510 [Pirellulales bacterium]|nr:hypothetical protein [Pirellulales bacterium]